MENPRDEVLRRDYPSSQQRIDDLPLNPAASIAAKPDQGKIAAIENQQAELLGRLEQAGITKEDITAHQLSWNPKAPPITTEAQAVEALQDHGVLREIRKAAKADGNEDGVRLLDKFESLENQRFREQHPSPSAAPPQQSFRTQMEP